MAKLAGSLPLGLHVFKNPLRSLIIDYVMIYMGPLFPVLFYPNFYYAPMYQKKKQEKTFFFHYLQWFQLPKF